VDQPGVTAPTPSAATTSRLLYLVGDFIEVCGPSPVARGLAVTITSATVDAVKHELVETPAEVTVTDAAGTAVLPDPRFVSFRARFPHTGTFVVSARFEDGEVVTREVTVAEPVGVRLGFRGRSLVTHGAGSDCTEGLAEDAPLQKLAVNQELQVWVLPVDERGTALLGTLDLEFSGRVAARQTAPGALLNSFALTPTEVGSSVLTIKDSETQLELQVPLEVDAAPAVCAGS
jgi:hypothetical protein